ncbi:MAG TPA: ScyD/ScyE family protein [Friedmanniella sp.]
MLVRNRVALVAATALTCAGLLGSGPATADTPKAAAETPATVKVVAKNLSDPRQLSASGAFFYVAESGLDQVAQVTKTGGKRTTVLLHIPNAQGVVRAGGRIYTTSGAAGPGGTEVAGNRRLYVGKPGQKAKTFADLLAYELKYDPDNQTQGTGPDADTLSNPYYVVKSRSRGGFLLVADAGANDVLAVNRKGRVSTFFVPPSVTTGDCAKQQQNSDAGPSCDAVPTGLAYGPGGLLYISALTSEVAGQGRVYVVDKNGKLVKTLTGFSGPTGVAVGTDGSVYVSEALQGAPEGAPPPGFNPDTIGQIVKVAPDAKRTYAQVSQPSGLLWSDGKLYASARSLYKTFLGTDGAGQIVSVDPSSFLPQ